MSGQQLGGEFSFDPPPTVPAGGQVVVLGREIGIYGPDGNLIMRYEVQDDGVARPTDKRDEPTGGET